MNNKELWQCTFAKTIINGKVLLTQAEKSILSDRKDGLNAEFVFTDEVIAKLKLLNDVLYKEQQQLMKRIGELRLLYPKDRLNELEVEYSFYKDGMNDPILETEIHFTEEAMQGGYLLDFPEPLQKINPCYFFKAIHRYTHLAWEDLLSVDTLWTEIKLILQSEMEIYKP